MIHMFACLLADLRLMICGDGRSFGGKQTTLWCLKVMDLKDHKATSMQSLYPLAIMNCSETHGNCIKYCGEMVDQLAKVEAVERNGKTVKVFLKSHSV